MKSLLSVLVLALAPRTASITLCSSPITLSNNQVEYFHVEHQNDINKQAQLFCIRYTISQSDCQRIIDHHKRRCFSSEETAAAEQPHEEEQPQQQQEPGSQTEITDIPKNSIDLVEVDYSQRVGPILPVHFNEITRNLQMYLGETPPEAIKRFCQMLQLNGEQCSQVQQAFLKLLQAETKIPLETPLQDTPSEVEEDSHSEESQRTQLTVDWLYDQLVSLVEKYWNYLFLLLTIVYVIRENPLHV